MLGLVEKQMKMRTTGIRFGKIQIGSSTYQMHLRKMEEMFGRVTGHRKKKRARVLSQGLLLDTIGEDTNPPMKTRYLAYPIVIVFLVLVILVKHSTDKDGLPAIKSSVDQQLSNLRLQSTNLNGLEVGRKGRVRIIGDAPPFRG